MKTLLSIIAICMDISVYAQNTDSSRFYFDKAIEEKNAGRYLVASKFFERSIQFNAVLTETYLQQGYTFLAMKRTDQAIVSFAKVSELDPSNETAINELMELYFNYRQYPKAIEFAQKCSDCKNSLRILGMSYYHQDDYTNAENYLAKAMEKDITNAELTYTMGRNYLEMEEYKKAVPFYIKAVQMDETRGYWMYELGLIYYNLNDFKNALIFFEKALANGYNRSNDYVENVGYASLYTGDYDKGERLLLEIWKKRPGNKDIIRDMAEILYQQKQFDRSLTYCQQLMEADPNDGKALYQAGLCFQKKGQKDRGQQMCDKAIQMDPGLESLRRKKDITGGR